MSVTLVGRVSTSQVYQERINEQEPCLLLSPKQLTFLQSIVSSFLQPGLGRHGGQHIFVVSWSGVSQINQFNTPSLGVMLNRLWQCQDYPDPSIPQGSLPIKMGPIIPADFLVSTQLYHNFATNPFKKKLKCTLIHIYKNLHLNKK